MPKFEVVSEFAPAGDQPQAVAGLAEGVNRGDRFQTLLGNSKPLSYSAIAMVACGSELAVVAWFTSTTGKRTGYIPWSETTSTVASSGTFSKIAPTYWSASSYERR